MFNQLIIPTHQIALNIYQVIDTINCNNYILAKSESEAERYLLG